MNVYMSSLCYMGLCRQLSGFNRDGRRCYWNYKSVSSLLNCGGFNMAQWLSFSRTVFSTVIQPDFFDLRSRCRSVTNQTHPRNRTCYGIVRMIRSFWNRKFNLQPQLKTSFTTSHLSTRSSWFPIVNHHECQGPASRNREIWKSLGDDPFPQNFLSIWNSFGSQIHHIHSNSQMLAAKRIPIGYELHVSSDAFELGFGTCVYLRAKYASGN